VSGAGVQGSINFAEGSVCQLYLLGD